ncbi:MULTISPECIES: PAS domain S-box protein [Roseivirga]|jgi:PAS domain S-box-containing protein|uniref:histidine kinase n=1 Tax=Roseivirga thermotolerans TaxID=1758176 RepID=A0ABQ3I9G1_9BACT|nr:MULTISPECIES: PAS domain S-box protein [Roseivirga]MEC7754846.1 PAS domain S-box protein [Bacteroidota bacterium]GHE69154.1 hypothetical protein GCM10011340_26330 [Roseivirga thermotolerans]|tara:strand:- start:5840 stop:7702 length:1863 start_codon:yes stop_codon:yes gene_type:complete
MPKSIFKLYEELFSKSVFAIAVTSYEGIPVFVNSKFCQMMGYSAEELTSMTFSEFTHPDDVNKNLEVFEKLKAGEIESYRLEKRYIRKTGEVIWAELTVELLENRVDSGYIRTYILDITEKKKKEEAMAKQELVFHEVFHNMFQLMGLMELDGTLIEANQSALDFVGYKRDEIVGKKFYDAPWWAWNDEIRSQIIDAIDRASQGEFVRFYTDILGNKGVETIDFSLRPIKQGGKVVLLIPEGRPIPQEKEIEKELLAKNLLLEKTEKLSKTGGWILQIKDLDLKLSNNAYELLGLPRNKKPTLKDVQERVHPEDLDHFNMIVQKALEDKQSCQHQYRVKTETGWRHIKSYGEPRFNKKGKAISLNGAIMDITAEMESEQKLQKINDELNNKVQELRQFAYVTAHDLQEPLRTIISFIQLLKATLKDANIHDDTELYTEYIEKSANRLKNLIKDLLHFSQLENQKLTFERVNLQKVFHQVKADLHNLIKTTNASVECSELPQIIANETRINVLFQNLINNAIKFRRQGIRPQIRVEYTQNNDFHYLSFSDNGIGIDKEYHQYVFEIFKRLSSREEYEGTGIGLAMCKKIADQHNGVIDVESVVDEGTTFRVAISKKLTLSY